MTADQLSSSGDGPAVPALRQGGVGDIGGGVRSAVTDPQGNVHTGDGHQYNIAEVHIQGFLAEPAVQRDVGIRPGQAGMKFLQRVFVEPDGFEALRESLQVPGRTAVLTGRPGSGRRAAAQMVLCPTLDDISALTLLTAADLQGSDRLTDEDVSEGTHLLLDISDLDQRAFADRQTDLVRCAAIVGRQRASLVILIPDGLEDQLHDDLQIHRRPVGRPDGWRVLTSHLERGWNLTLPRSAVAADDGRALAALPLRSIARVAFYLAQTREQGLPRQTWFRNALAGLADQEHEVIRLLNQCRSVEERTLLLVTAVLEGAGIDAIYFAEHSLLGILDYAAESPPHRLAQFGITDRLRELDDHIRVVDGTARFVRPGFGDAVLTHFWDAYPDLRPRFADWIRTVYSWRATRADDWTMVARRFAVQSTRTNRSGDLQRVVEHWSTSGREETRRLAIEAMTPALLDDRFGPRARQYLYALATRPNLEQGLGRLAIELCTDVVAIGHPQQALIRLRWLTERDAVSAEAKRAIVSLCEDNRTLELFIHVLTDRDRFDPELARHVLAPRRLTADEVRAAPLLVPRLRRKAVEVWVRSLQDANAAAWRSAITPWLDEHARLVDENRPPIASALLSALIDICSGDITRLAQLNTANESWLANHRTSAQALTTAAAVEHALDRSVADLPSTSLGDRP
ncbi:hypothetical protein ACI2LF_34560 [Kribbella sp. NPDC020789]